MRDNCSILGDDILQGVEVILIDGHQMADALSKAAKVAGYCCQFFGTRRWLKANL